MQACSIRGSDSGNRLADKADPVQCYRRLVLNDQPEIRIDVIADQIIARQHGDDAGKLFGLRGIDLDDARVRMRTVKHARMEHSG